MKSKTDINKENKEVEHMPTDPAIPVSYYIFKKLTTYYSKNGITGNLDFNNTDAYTVIQNTINSLTSGGRITIGDIAPSLTSGLQVNNPNIIIEGFGTARTILTANNSLNSDIITIKSSNVKLRDFSIDGNKSNQTTGRGIVVTSPTDLIMDSSFDNLAVKNCKADGIFLDNTIIDLRLSKILTELNGGDGFNINGSDNYFTSCESRSNTNNGWELTGSSHELVNCASSGNSKTGIIGGSFRSDFIGCFVDRNGDHGMYLSGDLNNVIGGHYYLNNKDPLFIYGTGITVVGKQCKVVSTRIGEAPSGSDTQQHQYNLYIQPTADNTIASNNTLIAAGASIGNFLDQGTNTIIDKNFGYSQPFINAARGVNTTYTNPNQNSSILVVVIMRCQITAAGGKATAQAKADTANPPTTPISGEFGIQVGLSNEDNSIAASFVVGPGLNYRLDTITSNGTVTPVSWFELSI